jgi:glutamate formiminotransferase
MQDVFAAVQVHAVQAGVEIRRSEVVGLLPQDALVGLARSTLKAAGFTSAQVLEARILDSLL